MPMIDRPERRIVLRVGSGHGGETEKWLQRVCWRGIVVARCVRVVLKLSFGGKVCQVRRGVRVCLWAPCMVAKCNRCVMSLCDGGQAARSVSCVGREWYAGEVCQVNGCTWRLA